MTFSILLVIFLMVTGVLLLVAELFLLPGFGVAGITGFGSLVGAVIVAYVKLNPVYPWAGEITLIACIVLAAVAVYLFFRSHALEKMGLDTSINSSVEMPEAGKHMNQMMEQDAKKEPDTNTASKTETHK